MLVQIADRKQAITESITKRGLREKRMSNAEVIARLLVNEQSGFNASDLSVSHLVTWH